MTSKKNTITFNGKVYDATTGALISNVNEKPAHSVSTPKQEPKVKKSGMPHTVVSAKKIHHNHVDKAKTLRRDTVRNPARLTRPKKVQSDLLSTASGSAHVVQHAQRVTDARLIRAQETSKSNLVSHFGNHHSHVVVKKQQAVQIAKAPPVHGSQARAHQQKQSSKDMLIDAALLKSLSHEQPRHHLSKRRHRVAHKLGLSPRFVSLSTTAVVVLALAGLYVYQNIPRFAVGIASSKAGLQASYPGFHPQGFAQAGSVSYRPGEVFMDFSSRDSRSYRIIQSAADPNDPSVNNVLGDSTRQPIAAHQVAGRTIYIAADGSKASWVDDGIHYTIEANSVLSTDQILKIAASL